MPELAYRITEWKSRYEVTYKGRAADENTPLEELRIGPLEFVRFKVFGHRPGPAMKRIIRMAEQYGPWAAPGIFGIFGKLLELSGNSRKEYRGWVLCEKQKPVDSDGIAEILGFDEKIVSIALEILCNPKVGWIQHVEYIKPEDENKPVSRNFPEHSGTSGIPFKKTNESENETKARKQTKEQTKEQGVPEKPGTDSLSPSISSRSSLALASQTSGIRTLDALEKIFPHRTAADDSTFSNIVRQVLPHKHEQLLELAQKSTTGDNPIAKFVDLAKRRLGFRGNGGL